MKKHPPSISGFVIFLVLILGTPLISLAHSIDKKQLARQALQRQDYQQVISICQRELQKNPNDYDYNFLLARAEGYRGNWDKSLEIINSLLEIYHQNLDLLLFRARLLGWKGEYTKAQQSFEEILQLEPNNLSAWLGLVDLALWQHKYNEALAICQKLQPQFSEEPKVYFKLAQSYYHLGRLDYARQYIQQALKYEPANEEFRQLLRLTAVGFRRENEIRYSFELMAFNDHRTPYQTHSLTLELGLPRKKGAFLLIAQQTRRFNRNDASFGAELYYNLRPGTYTHLNFHLGSPAIYFPRSTYHAEIYQSVLRQGEISLGFRQYNFKAQSSLVYTGSAGVYWGRFFSFLRWFFNQENGGQSWAWFTQTRLYFSSTNYLFFGFGRGSRPFEVVTIEDWLTRKSSLLLGGLNWTIAHQLHLRSQFTYREDEGGVRRYTVFASLGYKF
ncbi:YaiO family outer membrane beta-barrel protein [Candidatus Aminicenantes bacterium AC-334-K16]|nr:YaiO family outer membrane beta-barrel protein [Candidatus Aminicenantes bacterium AC-334-K16]